MSSQPFVAGSTRVELQQQLKNARKKERKAKATLHQELKHSRRPEAGQPDHEMPMETELEGSLATDTVCYLRSKLLVTKCEEHCNTAGHQLDLARINLHIDQLHHQAILEKAGNKLRRYEAKIAAGNEGYVTRKAHKERDMNRYHVLAKQSADRRQKIIEIFENLMTTSKLARATCEKLMASSERTLRLREKAITKCKRRKMRKARKQKQAEAQQ